MSKVSEWTRAYEAAYGQTTMAPALWLTTAGFGLPRERALVTPHGELSLGGIRLTGDEALKLARWILEVFED